MLSLGGWWSAIKSSSRRPLSSPASDASGVSSGPCEICGGDVGDADGGDGDVAGFGVTVGLNVINGGGRKEALILEPLCKTPAKPSQASITLRHVAKRQ